MRGVADKRVKNLFLQSQVSAFHEINLECLIICKKNNIKGTFTSLKISDMIKQTHMGIIIPDRLRNRSLSAGLEPVLSQTGKSCLASYILKTI